MSNEEVFGKVGVNVGKTENYADNKGDKHWVDKGFERSEDFILSFAIACFTCCILAFGKNERYAPNVNKSPKRNGEDNVFEHNFVEKRVDNGVTHKPEVGKAKTVYVRVAFGNVFSEKSAYNQNDRNHYESNSE